MTTSKTDSIKPPLTFAVVVASNDELVLADSLMRSPDIRSIKEIIVRRDFGSASQAYNSGLDAATADVVVFAHQDVFFPEGWFKALAAAIAALPEGGPDWGVLGVYGINEAGEHTGHIYSTGLQKVLGHSFARPVAAGSLDEVVLIVRRSSGLRFDEKLPGFHLYGTDICLEAQRRNLKSYIISAFCVHNSNGLDKLPSAYSRAARFLRDKWSDHLPIRTPCVLITRWGFPLFRHYLESLLARNRKSGARCADPAALYRQLQKENRIENGGGRISAGCA